MRSLGLLLSLTLAASCSFRPIVPPASVFCEQDQDCAPGERCRPAGKGVCCAEADCPPDKDGGSGQPHLQITISSIGGGVAPASPPGMRIQDDGFEQGDRACAASVCVTGGITP